MSFEYSIVLNQRKSQHESCVCSHYFPQATVNHFTQKGLITVAKDLLGLRVFLLMNSVLPRCATMSRFARRTRQKAHRSIGALCNLRTASRLSCTLPGSPRRCETDPDGFDSDCSTPRVKMREIFNCCVSSGPDCRVVGAFDEQPKNRRDRHRSATNWLARARPRLHSR